MSSPGLVFVFVLTLTFYLFLNRRKSKYYWESRLDKNIPVIPVFVIPYLFYFVYVPAAIALLYEHSLFLPLMLALISGNIINSIFWFIFPNGVKRPDIKKNAFFQKILKFIYYHDKDTNGCPSAHVFHTLVASYFLALAYQSLWPLFLLVSILISLSVIFTKQHNVVDIFGGILSFSLCILLVEAII